MRAVVAAALALASGACGRLEFDSLGGADGGGAPDLTSGLVMYMPFDDDPTDGVAALGSASPTAHCATTCPAIVAGRFGGAYQFDGTLDGVIVDDVAAYHLTTGTIAFWVQIPMIPSQGDDWFMVGSPFQSTGDDTWELTIVGDVGHAEVYGGGDSDGTGEYHIENLPAVATWVHIAMTWDDRESFLFFDGHIQHTLDPIPMTFDSHGIYAGIDDNGGPINDAFPGMLDDLRLYDHVLTTDEVKILAGRP